MKKQLTCALMGLCLAGVSNVQAADIAKDIEFNTGATLVSEYIWRGIKRSNNTNVQTYLNWEKDNWSGSFGGSYDFATDNHITDYDADWLEFNTELAYTWDCDKNGSEWTLGYRYYSFQDDFYDTQEVFVKYVPKNFISNWNPEFSAYFDFDLNEGSYWSVDFHRTQVDRDWEYRFGLKLGYLQDFGQRVYDSKRIGNTSTILMGWFDSVTGKAFAGDYSGLADVVPSITLTKHFDEESSMKIFVAGSIHPENSTYNTSVDDSFYWGASYNLKF